MAAKKTTPDAGASGSDKSEEDVEGLDWLSIAGVVVALAAFWWLGCFGTCLRLILGTRPDVHKTGFEKLDAAETGASTSDGINPVPDSVPKNKKASVRGEREEREERADRRCKGRKAKSKPSVRSADYRCDVDE